jgi:hypothetical protein
MSRTPTAPPPLAVRLIATWLSIVPLVLVITWLLLPLVDTWFWVYRTTLIISIVIPIAVTWVSPFMLRLVQRMWPAPR